MRKAILTAAILLSAGCGRPRVVDPDRSFRVQLTGATVAPGQSNGEQWDGLTKLPAPVALAIAHALRLPTSEELIAVVPLALSMGVAAPEPYGTATLYRGNGAEEPRPLSLAAHDTFTPGWDAPPIVWHHVRVTEALRLNVSLWDSDLVHDDPIGQVQINETHLAQAIASRGVTLVRVSEQGNGHILFLSIAVTPD